MPHAIAFANGNVIHLLGKMVVQAVLPDVGVSVFGDGKGCRTLIPVLDYIEPGIRDCSEVNFE